MVGSPIISISAVATSQAFAVSKANTWGATGAKELRSASVGVKRLFWIALDATKQLHNNKDNLILYENVIEPKTG